MIFLTKIDLITGFLGSGKTTFIKHYASYLVAQGYKVGILENDFADELKYILEHKRRLVFDESQDMNFQLVSAVRALCMRNKYQKEEKSESEKAKSNNATPNSSEQPFVDTSSDDLDLHFEDENLDDEEGLTGYQITF